jgi:spore coat protein F
MYYSIPQRAETLTETRRHLAPHETLELHELLAFKNVNLYNMKKALPHITDPELKQIYAECIHVCDSHIRELASLLQHR